MMFTGFFHPSMQHRQGFLFDPKTPQPCRKCPEIHPQPEESAQATQTAFVETQTEIAQSSTRPSIVEQSTVVVEAADGAEEEDESDEEEDDGWMFGRGAQEGMYNFFPIAFGGGRSGGLPGATAIANSFSTGRKGVANSQATAYGDSSLLRKNG